MSSKKTLELDQLKQLSLSEIKAYKAKAEERKAELAALKADTKKGLTEEQQEELDEIAIFLVDVDDIIEEKEAEAAKTAYVVPKGEEQLVHLSIVNGRRFNPSTGKEESRPTVQKFSYGEFVVFKNNCGLLGYTVVKVLHDPYNEAHKLIKQ
jgi:hypothetical protein|nr:MAG TPA: hypothetical protein [Caudoviricetes sp.]